MNTNERLLDRMIRIAFGLTGAALIAMKALTGTAAVILGVASGIMLITGAVGFCGLYALFGVSTCKVSRKS
jgi:hypothetical protein